MFTRKIFRVVLIPGAAFVADAEGKCQKVTKGRPSELPIYQPDPKPLPKEAEATIPTVPSYIEDTFATVRIQLTKIYQEAKAYKRVGIDYLEQSKGNAEWLVNYLRQEDNTTPKAGAIGIGALTGLIFGLRGGLFKKTLYATTGALGMAAVCYPKEASEYSQIGISEAKKYATIAYNFAYGVKKDDPPLELPTLPKLPSSISEAWDTVTKSASSLVSVVEPETAPQVIESSTSNGDKTEIIDAESLITELDANEECTCPLHQPQ